MASTAWSRRCGSPLPKPLSTTSLRPWPSASTPPAATSSATIAAAIRSLYGARKRAMGASERLWDFINPDFNRESAVEAVPVSPQLLRVVHRRVGVAQQRVAVGSGGGKHRDADARAQPVARSLRLERLPEHAQHLLGHYLAIRFRLE